MTLPQRRSIQAAVATAALLVAGCGTTVAGTSATESDVTSQGGALSAPTPGAAAGGVTTPLDGGLSSPGTLSGGTGPAGPTTGGVAGSGGSTATGTRGAGTASSPLMGPGVTANKIYVGFLWPKNQDAVNQAAGAGNISVGDPKADAQAVVDEINKRGGIAGRQIVPVFQPINSASAQTLDSQYAAACDHFTHDQRVYAVVSAGPASYQACLSKAGILILDEDLPRISDTEFANYPAIVELAYPRLSRIAKAQLDAFAHDNYFSPWDTTAGGPAKVGKAKVGILTIEEAGFDAVVNNILIPGLKQLGYDPGSDVERIAFADNAADISNQAAANQSAELKFAADHVTHVVVFESQGGNSLLFMNQAESQHYRPRYGVNSGSGLETLLAAGDIQNAQAVGAEGFGWIPDYDLPGTMNSDTGQYSNGERRLCLDIFKRHGITFGNPNAEFAAMGFCASLELLKTVLDKTPNVITVDEFVQILDTLGTSFESPVLLETRLSATQHDAATAGYYWDYFASCKCLHYTGSLRAIPD